MLYTAPKYHLEVAPGEIVVGTDFVIPAHPGFACLVRRIADLAEVTRVTEKVHPTFFTYKYSIVLGPQGANAGALARRWFAEFEESFRDTHPRDKAFIRQNWLPIAVTCTFERVGYRATHHILDTFRSTGYHFRSSGRTTKAHVFGRNTPATLQTLRRVAADHGVPTTTYGQPDYLKLGVG